MLSSWVYTDDPEPPQMAHADFEVHAVIQPGDLGRSVKIASVTAELPVGRVLFIVFKGTSYMLDFLNWNLEHDHEITGEAVLSSMDLQSFTFGAPMVFGGNSQNLSPFKDFARDHAVNYILADDPCARAWGALDLRHFVQQATQAVKKGLKDTLGSLKGTLASTVVEAMAEALLGRPDFLMIQDFARKYEHAVPLRVLSANRQHFRWKEFNLTPECFEDHSMESYVNKLFDAFDSSRPECHIHHQTSLTVNIAMHHIGCGVNLTDSFSQKCGSGMHLIRHFPEVCKSQTKQPKEPDAIRRLSCSVCDFETFLPSSS